MTDLRTAMIGPDDVIDLVRRGATIDEDGSIRTAVLLSLFTDRRAAPDDELPEGAAGDRRGWWGDALPAAGPDGAPAERDRIGSRLWLLARAKQTRETLNRAVTYARESLQWLVDDGHAAAVDVSATWAATGVLVLTVTIRGLPDESLQAVFEIDV